MELRVREALQLVYIIRRDELARSGLTEIGQRVAAFEIRSREISIQRLPRAVDSECGMRLVKHPGLHAYRVLAVGNGTRIGGLRKLGPALS